MASELPPISPQSSNSKLETTPASWQTETVMTAEKVLETVATMPSEEWRKIQTGIADLIASRLSEGENAEILEALAESEGEFSRGEGLTGSEVRRRLGLP